MLLESVTPRNFGPFLSGSTLKIDPELTVLTGANDVGKSSLLRCIALMCKDSQEPSCSESDVNNVYHFGQASEWESDPAIGGTAVFALTDRTGQYVPLASKESWPRFEIDFHLAPQVKTQKVLRWERNGRWVPPGNSRVGSVPDTVVLPRKPDHEVRDQIPVHTPSLVERELLEVAFDGPFDIDRWAGMSEVKLQAALSRAEERLTSRFRQLFSEHAAFSIRIRSFGVGQDRQLAIHLEDPQGEMTPLGYRGAGVRKAMRLLGVLHRVRVNAGHTIVLVDEPENSLHPDAQHFVRSLLEDVASHEHIQVVIATHAPAMINGMRPESVRLLTRATEKDNPGSRIDNSPIQSGFLSVRANLGMSVADTLHLAPVTVVVEGISEAHGIPLLMRLLASESEEFAAGIRLMGQAAIWDCGGDDFDKCCGLAKSQRLSPIAWLDGDKHDKVLARQRKTRHLNEVPVVLLPHSTEFEDLLSREVYFRGVAASDEALAGVTADMYDTWEKEHCDADSKEAFTKRVDRWIASEFPGTTFRKVLVLRSAIELASPDDVNGRPFAELLRHIAQILGYSGQLPTVGQ